MAAGFWVALATVFPGFCVGFACPGFCSEPVVACAVFGETATVALGDRTGVGEISDDGLALGNGLFEDAEGWLLQPAKTQSNTPTTKNCAIRFIGLLLSLTSTQFSFVKRNKRGRNILS